MLTVEKLDWLPPEIVPHTENRDAGRRVFRRSVQRLVRTPKMQEGSTAGEENINIVVPFQKKRSIRRSRDKNS